MRLNLNGTTIFTTEYTLTPVSFTPHNPMHAIEIQEGYMDINSGSLIGCLMQEHAKAEREKVWEMARKVYGPVERGGLCGTELKECFGSLYPGCMFTMDVDEALEKYEFWKKKNSVEELIKSLKPQDVVAVPKIYERDSYCVYMVTMVIPCAEASYTIHGVKHTGDTILNLRTIEEYKGLEKIGRVVETTDILGEIKKIEDEWRKNR